MNKYFLFLILATAYISSASAQSIYDINIRDIKGQPVNFNTWQGKKILFIVLAGNETDSAAVNQIAVFKNKFAGQVEVIGIPSIEAGAGQMSNEAMDSLYKRDGNMALLLAENMYVNETSGTTQSGLLQWLTHKEQNGHFDQKVKDVGQKFFIDGSGSLYAVMGSDISLTAPVIEKIISK